MRLKEIKIHWKKLRFIILPYKRTILLAYFIIVIGMILSLVQPIVWAEFLTYVYSLNDSKELWFCLIAMIAIMIMNLLISSTSRYISINLNKNITKDLKLTLFKKITNLDYEDFQKHKNGELVSRIENDSGIISRFVTNSLINISADFIKIIIFSIAVFTISWELALISLFGNALISITYFAFGKKIKVKTTSAKKSHDSYYSYLVHILSGYHEVINLFARQKVHNDYSEVVNDVFNKKYEIEKTNLNSEVIAGSITIIMQLLLNILGLFFLLKGVFPVQKFLIFSSYSSQLGFSVTKLTRTNILLQQTIVSIDRIFEVISFKEFNSNIGTFKYFKDYCLEISNLTFVRGSKQIINDISLVIRENEKVLLKGPSGEGKSTFAKLIARLYEPTSGSIKIGGTEHLEYDEEIFRKNIKMVSQDLFLADRSIYENICLGSNQISENDTMDLLSKLGLLALIKSLDKGVHTIISSENCMSLSQGEKQRIVFARSVVSGAKIYIFDEITSALDKDSQQLIFDVVEELSINASIIMISHKIDEIGFWDRICTIEEGRITSKECS